ncbi:hypothetical protein AVEN_65352-1 [Araneus ventricosus]|uniref:Uncharacterized protein n=1 Tax=Araneus ventricosus TaxID=182803 RepID=A0A4Y2H6M8_ARAVE|nr:hypothetical protein AVEN_65352-1 [Araneus ventricosus]
MGHLRFPKPCLGTTGQATKKRDCSVQNGACGHINQERPLHRHGNAEVFYLAGNTTVDSRLNRDRIIRDDPLPSKKEAQIVAVGMCGKTAFFSTLPIVLDSSSRP